MFKKFHTKMISIFNNYYGLYFFAIWMGVIGTISSKSTIALTMWLIAILSGIVGLRTSYKSSSKTLNN